MKIERLWTSVWIVCQSEQLGYSFKIIGRIELDRNSSAATLIQRDRHVRLKMLSQTLLQTVGSSAGRSSVFLGRPRRGVLSSPAFPISRTRCSTSRALQPLSIVNFANVVIRVCILETKNGRACPAVRWPSSTSFSNPGGKLKDPDDVCDGRSILPNYGRTLSAGYIRIC